MPVQIDPGSFTPTRADTSLSQRLFNWSAQLGQQREKKMVEQAYQEGLAAPSEKKEVKFFGGKTAEAFNKGAMDAYVIGVDRDNTNEVNRIALESQGDLQNFDLAIDKYRQGVLRNVDPVASNQIAMSLDSMIGRARGGVERQAIETRITQDKETRNSAYETYSEEAIRLTRNQDLEGARENLLKTDATLQSMVNSGDISQVQADEMFRITKIGSMEQAFRQDVMATADEDIEQAYRDLDQLSREVPEGFQTKEWDRFIAQTQTELNRKVSRMTKEAKAAAANAKKEQDYSAIEARYLEGDDTQIINPKLLDSYYNDVLSPRLAMAETPELARQQKAHFVERMKSVPKTMKLELTNAIESGNPELMEDALLTIERLDTIEGVVDDLPIEKHAYLKTALNLLPNMEPREAMNLARKATDPTNKSAIEARELQIKEQFKRKNKMEVYSDKASDVFKTMFFGPEPDEYNRAQMGKEYGDLYEAARKAGMSEEDAFDKANKMIERNWGKSELFGDKVMKYRPESYYEINGDVTWVRDQLMAVLNDPVNPAMFGRSIKPEEVILISNAETERTASMGAPGYAVSALIDGQLIPVFPGSNFFPDADAEKNRIKELNVKEALEDRKKKMKAAIKAKDVEFSSMSAM